MAMRLMNTLLEAIAAAVLLLSIGQVRADGQTISLPNPLMDVPLAKASGKQTAILAGGCFWGMQALFQHVKGVVSATAGYAGGAANTAQYELVSTGVTGHAESVKVTFDPSKISYGQLLKVYFSVAHDPTLLNRQGPDTGTQYRSEIFATGAKQRKIAEAYIRQLDAAKVYPNKIVTQVTERSAFYPAEDYHQNFAALHPNNPYIVLNDLPRVDHLRKQFPELFYQGATSK
jgi:peptide-methionine (S)-S-oxide reductase